MDSVSKYLLGMLAEERDHRVGDKFIGHTLDKLLDRYAPYYMTDGYLVYTKYMRKHLGAVVPHVYKKRCWHTRKKNYVYKDGVNYGQVVKTRNGNKLEKVEYIQVSGEVPKQFFNTSAVERMNLTIRNGMARLKRICQTFSKNLDQLQCACKVFRAYYNFCRPHMSLSKGSCKVTPAMKIGVTDRVWDVHDLMTFCYRQNIRC